MSFGADLDQAKPGALGLLMKMRAGVRARAWVQIDRSHAPILSIPGRELMLRSAKTSAAHREALRRVKQWARARFALPADAIVFVSEVACSLPGCPPLETIVAFWTDGTTRHQFKVFKPVEEIVEDDLPPSWMKDALISDGLNSGCC